MARKAQHTLMLYTGFVNYIISLRHDIYPSDNIIRVKECVNKCAYSAQTTVSQIAVAVSSG
jgi:hypothetical protein